jgi:hypothetical protein
VLPVGQLSFYSAEANAPRVADLAGVLCGPGRTVGFGAGTAARLAVTVGQRWRAVALVAACARRGVTATVTGTDAGTWLVRTAFRTDLVDLAAAWTGADGKSVPDRFLADGVTLRLWAVVAGRWCESGYLLGLDPDSPSTHQPLVAALVRAGMPVALVDDGAGGPAARIRGVRRLARLVELVGDPPAGVPGHDWPATAGGNSGPDSAVRVKTSIEGVT